MKGRYHTGGDKWLHVNQIIRENKIGILTLQETHLCRNEALALENIFPRLRIFSTVDEDHPNAKGVAIVLNKDILNTDKATCQEISVR